MKKFVTTLAILIAAMLGASDLEVWYVHGWSGLQSGKGSPERTSALLQDFFPSTQVHVEEWNSDDTFFESAKAADAFAEVLAEKIEALPENRRKNLILVGHSLGGRVVVRTTAKLSRKHIAIRQAVFLAAAIPADDEDCAEVFRQRLTVCTNVYCPEDKVLKNSYGMGGEEQPVDALGAVGHDVPAFHHQYCRKDNAGHGVVECLSCLKARMGTPSDPPIKRDLKVRYGCKPFKTLSLGKGLIDQYKGWRLYKKMIVDPLDWVRAVGTERQMRESFDDIKRQLNAP